MKRKRKNNDVTLSEIVENEIKLNGLRQGFSKALNKSSKTLNLSDAIKIIDEKKKKKK